MPPHADNYLHPSMTSRSLPPLPPCGRRIGRRYWRVSQILQCIGEREDVRCVVNRTTARRHTQASVRVRRLSARHPTQRRLRWRLRCYAALFGVALAERQAVRRPFVTCPSPLRSHTARFRNGPHSFGPPGVIFGDARTRRAQPGRDVGRWVRCGLQPVDARAARAGLSPQPCPPASMEQGSGPAHGRSSSARPDDWSCRQSERRRRAPFGGGNLQQATAILRGA